MTGRNFYSLLFIFFLCSCCFVAGWLTAVYVLPGALFQADSQKSVYGQTGDQSNSPVKSNEGHLSETDLKKAETGKRNIPFFEEMRSNILLLFDPYKIDSAVKKNTYFEKKDDSFIKSGADKQIPIKIQKPVQAVVKKEAVLENGSNKNLKQVQTDEKNRDKADPSLSEKNFSATKKDEGTLALQELQKEYDKKNREQLVKIIGNQKFFTMDGQFGFLVNVFSEQDKALDYVKDIKNKHPLWSFLMKAHKDHIRVYLGPFQTKEKALEFKEMIASPSFFSQAYLEEVSL